MASAAVMLYEDVFQVNDLNPDGKGLQYHNGRLSLPPSPPGPAAPPREGTSAQALTPAVSRVIGKGFTYQTDLVIDIQSELFPVKVGDRLTMVLTRWEPVCAPPHSRACTRACARPPPPITPSTLDMGGKPDSGTYNQSGEVGEGGEVRVVW